MLKFFREKITVPNILRLYNILLAGLALRDYLMDTGPYARGLPEKIECFTDVAVHLIQATLALDENVLNRYTGYSLNILKIFSNFQNQQYGILHRSNLQYNFNSVNHAGNILLSAACLFQSPPDKSQQVSEKERFLSEIGKRV